MAECARLRGYRVATPAILLALAAAVTAGVSQPHRVAAQVQQGIDVSEYQGSIDWQQVGASGKSFAYIRAGDGSSYDDPDFQSNWNGARAAGITRGAYLFFEPSMDPGAQAGLLEQQLRSVHFVQGDLTPAIDVETTDGEPASTVVANLQTAVSDLGSYLGVLPVIYTSPDWWDNTIGSSAFTKDPLWVADWCGSCSSPSLPASGWGGNGWSAWQYSDAGSVPGIQGSVDLDQGGDSPLPYWEPFRPQVGALGATVTPDGTQLLFWQEPGNYHLLEGWYSGGDWNGPADLTVGQFGGAAPIYSAPAVAVTPDDTQQLVFWQGWADHLYEAWFAGARWNGPVDLTASAFGGVDPLANAPTVAVTPDGSTELVFWRGVDGHLYEAWYAGGHWNGPADWTAGALGSAAAPASSPSVTVTPDGSSQLVFWQDTNGHLSEAWWAGGRWNGPADWTSDALGGGALLSSSPGVAVTPDGSSQVVFWSDADGHLWEAWWAGGRWNGPADWTAWRFGNQGLLTAAPAVAVTPDGSSQLVFWQGAGENLWEAWWAGGRWNGPSDWTLGG